MSYTGRAAYRVPMGALLSLATSLLASLEAPWVALWTLSETIVGGVLDGVHVGWLCWLFLSWLVVVVVVW